MIKREKYIKEIRPFYESDLIKIITGVRRSGKSLALPQLKQWDSCFSDSYLHIVNHMPNRAVSTSFIYTVSVCPAVQFMIRLKLSLDLRY